MATSSVTWWLIFGHLQQWKFAKVGTKFCQLLNPNKKRHKLKNKPNWQKLANLVTLKARGCNLLLDLDVLFEPPRSCDNLSRYKITSSLKSFIKIYLAKSISWVKKKFLSIGSWTATKKGWSCSSMTSILCISTSVPTNWSKKIEVILHPISNAFFLLLFSFVFLQQFAAGLKGPLIQLGYILGRSYLNIIFRHGQL